MLEILTLSDIGSRMGWAAALDYFHLDIPSRARAAARPQVSTFGFIADCSSAVHSSLGIGLDNGCTCKFRHLVGLHC